jgi:hypothetical protein
MRKAEPLAGLGGLVLLVSLFLPWFTSGVAIGTRGANGTVQTVTLGGSVSAWQALAVVDVVLALLALLALAVPVVSLATRGPAASIGTAVLASALGWIAIVLVAIELIAHSPDYGAWVGLAGSILAWVGSWLSMRDESTPGAVAPELPTRPAPPNISA